jgi:predicted  nucleic acid-binding Zn-ribbon protein
MLKTGLSVVSLMLAAGGAVAQDVPGIEICTVEKTMERRTSCLQSNVDFLKKSMTRDALEQQKKLDAAGRDVAAMRAQVEALKGTVAVLQKTVEQLQTQIQAQAADNKPKDAPAK